MDPLPTAVISLADQAPGGGDFTYLSRYLTEISRYRLLSREETERLALKVYEEGDSHAGRELVVANLRLVVKVVMGFQKYWMNNFLDLVQEGNYGLSKAVHKYNPHRGVKFSSYASYWIRAYILKFIMDNWRLVKIGTTQAQRKLFYSLNREKKTLEARGVTPTPELLARRLGVKVHEVVEMEQRMRHFDFSLETPVRTDSEVERKAFVPLDAPGVEEDVARKEFLTWFRHEVERFAASECDERERAILHDRLLAEEPRTLTEIAARFSLSRERIRQLEKGLLGKLRDLIGEQDVGGW